MGFRRFCRVRKGRRTFLWKQIERNNIPGQAGYVVILQKVEDGGLCLEVFYLAVTAGVCLLLRLLKLLHDTHFGDGRGLCLLFLRPAVKPGYPRLDFFEQLVLLFSTFSTAFHRVERSEKEGGAWGGRSISV